MPPCGHLFDHPLEELWLLFSWREIREWERRGCISSLQEQRKSWINLSFTIIFYNQEFKSSPYIFWKLMFLVYMKFKIVIFWITLGSIVSHACNRILYMPIAHKRIHKIKIVPGWHLNGKHEDFSTWTQTLPFNILLVRQKHFIFYVI